MSDETPELLTVSSAARRLGVAPSRIRTAIRAGQPWGKVKAGAFGLVGPNESVQNELTMEPSVRDAIFHSQTPRINKPTCCPKRKPTSCSQTLAAADGTGRAARRLEQKRPRPKRPRALGKAGARDRSRTGDPHLGKTIQAQAMMAGCRSVHAHGVIVHQTASPLTAQGVLDMPPPDECRMARLTSYLRNVWT